MSGAGWAQQKLPPPPPEDKPAAQQEQAPPEEDESLQPKAEYEFNPLQAEKDVQIGNFYFRKGSYAAAAGRFLEATKWDPKNAEAYLRLGDAEEKRKDKKAARQAWAKFVELAPEDKRVAEVKKRLASKH